MTNVLTYEQVGQILVNELELEDYRFSVDHLGREEDDKQATGLYFFRETKSYSYKLTVGSGRNRVIGFGIGVAHNLQMSNHSIESVYEDIIDDPRFFLRA